jgi:hypothetical protein
MSLPSIQCLRFKNIHTLKLEKTGNKSSGVKKISHKLHNEINVKNILQNTETFSGASRANRVPEFRDKEC